MNKNKEIFVNFLKRRRLYAMFCKECFRYYQINNHNNICSTRTINKHFNSTGKRYYLCEAFSWEDTIKGYNFWRDLNIEWIFYLKERNQLEEKEKNYILL